MRPDMKPIHTVLAASIGVLALLAMPLMIPSDEAERRVPPLAEGLPWQIGLLPSGETRVFGLILARSTLDDARAHLGGDVEVAMIVTPGESGSIEAFYPTITAGFVTGKMILTLEASLEQREAMLQRARKAEYVTGSTARRVELSTEDLGKLSLARISAVSFIPSANLDEEIVLQRFGVPVERIRVSEHVEHFLYPDKGVDVVLDAKGKELLQYVAPREFDRLLAPLIAAVASTASRQ